MEKSVTCEVTKGNATKVFEKQIAGKYAHRNLYDTSNYYLC